MNAHGPRLLVVDDDLVDRTRARRLLEGTFEVVFASSGEEALEQAGSSTFDGALVDYHLPDVDGITILQRLSELDIPVVMLTGQGDEETAVRAMQQGARDYLPKDRITRESLEHAVRRAIESGRLERRLAAARRELEDFVAVVAHDLRSPVATMIGLCESVRETAERRLDENESRFLDSSIEIGEDLIRLVGELGEYTRVGRDDRQFEDVDLREVAETVVDRLAAPIARTGAVVEIGDLPHAHGSRAGLSQLLQNLVANAIKFCEAETPRVRISGYETEEDVVLSVRDNGIGIPAEQRRSVFAPLKRLHARERFEGTGLGLATCARIVDQHDGRIWVEPAPGEGSVFRVELPIHQ